MFTYDYPELYNSSAKIESIIQLIDLIHAIITSKNVKYPFTSYWNPVIYRYYYMSTVNYVSLIPPMAKLPSCLGGKYLLTLS